MPTQEEDCKKLNIDLQCQKGPTQEEDCEKFCALVDEKMSWKKWKQDRLQPGFKDSENTGT